jgi:hypothetical protein
MAHDVFRLPLSNTVPSDMFPIGIVPPELEHGDYFTTKFRWVKLGKLMTKSFWTKTA